MYVLFGKETDDLVVLLGVESSDNSSIPRFNIESITLVEELGTLSPVVNVKFFDQVGHSLYYQPIMPDFTFILTMGRRNEETFQTRLKMTNVAYESNDPSEIKNVMVSIDFVSEHWEKLYKIQKSRSFQNKKISDVITQLSREVGFSSTDIETTNLSDTIIQPYWNNAKFIKWLSQQATTEQRRNGFTFYVDRNDKFSFKTFAGMYGGTDDIIDIPHNSVANAEAELSFNLPKIVNHYMPVLNNAGFGMQHCAFDYTNKRFIYEVISPDVYKSVPLSTHHMLANEHISSETINYNGRNINPAPSRNLMVNSTNNVQTMDIIVRGRKDLELGDVINLIMPVSGENDTQDTFNHIYGGKWLISKMIHQMNVANHDYSIICRLSRNGINLPPAYDDGVLLKAR